MNRDELLTRLGQTLVLLRNDLSIAVILPNYDEVKRFSRDFYARLDQLPAWLGVEMTSKTIGKCEWHYGKILFVNKTDRLKGHSLNVIYRSKRALTQANNEELEYFNFLAAITQQPVVDFDDE